MKKEIKRIANLINSTNQVLITSHKDPDGDSIGSQLALAQLLKDKRKDFRIVNQGNLPSKYRFLDQDGQIMTKSPKKAFQAGLAIVLECSTLDRIGWVEELIGAETKIVNIDHHSDNASFGTINYIDHKASAVGEMIYNILVYIDFPINSTAATQLYSAILTDTGRFRFANTTPRCLHVCADLVTLGANPKLITDSIYFSHEKNYMWILGHLLTNMEFFAEERICCFTLNRATIRKHSVRSTGTEGLIDQTLFIRGVMVGILLTELDGQKVRVTLRSQGKVDVSKLAKSFGGGGHRNAAGCTVAGRLTAVKKSIIKQIEMECM